MEPITVWLNAKRCVFYRKGAALGLILLFADPALAASDSCPNGNLTECTRYKKLEADIKSGDVPAELAALKAASQDLDPSLRSLIYGIALKNSDMLLRTAAIRYILAGRSTLNIHLELPPHPTSVQQKYYNHYPVLHLGGLKINDNSDEIQAAAGANLITGNLIQGGFEMNIMGCTLRMIAGEEAALRGTLQCPEGPEGVMELPATLNLS